jgi:hypothetical protein
MKTQKHTKNNQKTVKSEGKPPEYYRAQLLETLQKVPILSVKIDISGNLKYIVVTAPNREAMRDWAGVLNAVGLVDVRRIVPKFFRVLPGFAQNLYLKYVSAKYFLMCDIAGGK